MTLTVHQLSHQLGRQAVLKDIELQVPAGQFCALIGPNGAGKSTLLALMARLMRPDRGQVLLDGLDVHRAEPLALARRLALFRQDNHLEMRLTVRELVNFGRYPHCQGRPGPADHAAVQQALQALQLDTLAERPLQQLSGGQRQRAHLAMALAQDTPVLLLDEPLNNLDLRHAAEIMALLRTLCDTQGRTVIAVLHDLNFAASWCDRLVALRDGQLVAQGPVEAIMQPAVLAQIYGMPIDVLQHQGRPLAACWRPSKASSR